MHANGRRVYMYNNAFKQETMFRETRNHNTQNDDITMTAA